jgi:pyruvate,water dikinase
MNLYAGGGSRRRRNGQYVDVGAPLGHAVIVGGVLGIPCLVSAIGATGAVPGCAMVWVGGTSGLVTVGVTRG